MPKIRLTDLAIKTLPPGLYIDERTPSFALRVLKNRKTWLVIKGENRTKVRIGHYPDLSLSDARKKALVAIGSPLAPPSAPGFTDARDEYLKQGKWRERSRYEITRTLNRHFSWTKAIDKITHRDVAEAIDKIGAPGEAAHAFKDIRSLFNWCVPRYLSHSPCAGLKPPSKYSPRARVLSDDELRKVWHALADDTYGNIVKLIILLGTRVSETSAIEANFLDGGILTIPGKLTKNSRDLRVPVPKLSEPIIAKNKSFVGFGKRLAQLQKASGVSGFTHHDLRRTYATNMQRLGVRIEVTERLINHISGSQSGLTGIYQRHDFFPEMQKAVTKYERFLTALIKART